MNKYLFIIILLFVPIFCYATELTPEKYYSGSGDYTDAIQACINEASKTGQKIHFTGKEYPVRGGVLIMKSNVTMYSDCGSRIFTNDHNNYKSIIYQDIHSIIENVVIDGLFFDQSLEVTSVCPSEVNYHIILLFKARNVKVQNCKFHHVGTNCIVVNGGECRGSNISGNDIFFERIKDAPYYDVSSIYIEDSKHNISKNHIYNDGSEQNRQGGGIETHGAIGTVVNNIMENCSVAINVVSFNGQNTTWDGNFNRTISNNTAIGCNSFVVFWAIKDNTIKNVVIKKNKATGLNCAIKIQPGNDLSGDIENITITKNEFEGHKHIFINEIDVSKKEHLYNYESVSFQNFGNASISITKNTFTNFPGVIVDLNVYSKEVSTNLLFCNNKLNNCFCGFVREPLSLQSKFALFSVGPYANLIAEKNIIVIPSLDPSIPPYYIYGNKEGEISVIGNKFKGIELTYTKTDNNRILGYDKHLQTKNYVGKEFNKVTPHSLNKGDVVLFGKEKKVCIAQGTAKIDRLSNGVLHGGFIVYLTCNNSETIDIGDWIVIKGPGVSQQARQVTAIVNDRIYIKDINFALPLGKSIPLSKIEFFPYVLE